MSRKPLPLRNGVDPVRTRIPAATHGQLAHVLATLFPGTEQFLEGEFAGGRVVRSDGRALAPSTAAYPGLDVWMYRPLPPEPQLPPGPEILYQDENLLVVDKPHFLPTIPRGAFVTQTALVRLRVATGNALLSPAHRLDRLTAGVLLFTTRPEVRGAYQSLFAAGGTTKLYEALAPTAADRALPRVLRSRILKRSGELQAFETDGAPNAETYFEGHEPLMHGISRYHLRPTTGRTHQLRIHLASVARPILGDPLYPAVTPWDVNDFSTPLQLLARELRFRDPYSAKEHVFRSQLDLQPPMAAPPDPS